MSEKIITFKRYMEDIKIVQLPISKFIDTKFREYSIYVLNARGIPSFYDALTPVQRYILMNSPPAFGKTLTVVGKSIEDSYHHGDSSLQGAISKLARPFGSAMQILEGYGFFGSEVCPEPAAARYTSVRLSPLVNDILKRYKHLSTRDHDGPYHPFWLDIPLGLTTTIVGIAVGYKTTILPRKLLDIQKFLKGEIKSLKPFFRDFHGKISRHKDLGNAWILSSKIKVDGSKITIAEIPPILKYNTVLKKLDQLIATYDTNVRIVNNSNTHVNIDIIYRGKDKHEWKNIQNFIKKSFSIIVTESPVFIKDGQVLVYDNIEQYLEDYKWQVKRLALQHCQYERDIFLDRELKFNIAKKEFINFILIKKRDNIEIDKFLKPFDKDLRERIERLTSRKFTKDELILTTQKIKELTKDLKAKEKELKKLKIIFNKTKDPTLQRGISSKKANISLFETEDVEESENGIFIWNGEDVFENNNYDDV